MEIVADCSRDCLGCSRGHLGCSRGRWGLIGEVVCGLFERSFGLFVEIVGGVVREIVWGGLLYCGKPFCLAAWAGMDNACFGIK